MENLYFHLWSHDLDFFTPPPSRPSKRNQKSSIHQDSARLTWLCSDYKWSLKDLLKAIWKIKKGSGSQLSLGKFDQMLHLFDWRKWILFLTQRTQSKIFRFAQSYSIFIQNNTRLLWFSPFASVTRQVGPVNMHTICISTSMTWQLQLHGVILVDTFLDLNEAYMTISKAGCITSKPWNGASL